MGTTLIFVGQRVVTDLVYCSTLLDWSGREEVPGNSPRIRPYPKPTQVGQVEYTKALERITILKELGKLHPVT